jgi:hypothetical protein
VLYEAQRDGKLATTGPYAHVRHPQYDGFILIMLGFLFQWPTLITVIMFPILVTMYVKLARREVREVLAEFGDQYRRYAAITPAFIPGFGLRQRVALEQNEEKECAGSLFAGFPRDASSGCFPSDFCDKGNVLSERTLGILPISLWHESCGITLETLYTDESVC